jgi:flagellar hook-associated protein 1 FlgK
MGLLNSALQIGRSALLSYQGALQVVGNNISSAASEDYTRLTPELDPLQGAVLAGHLRPGAGVALTGIQRTLDEALEDRVRLAVGAHESAVVQQAAMARIEVSFDNISGTDVATRLTDFFNNMDELQNRPDDLATRDLTITSGALLAESLHTLRDGLTSVGEDMDGRIADLVAHADDVARRIAELNEEITAAEAGTPAQATGLRDQRDALLHDLSEIFDVTVREQPNGTLNVYIGNEALVQGNFVRGLIAVQEIDGDVIRTSARFADTNQQLSAAGGRIAGLITSRDQYAYGRIAAIDELAAVIIANVNRIHADGQGLIGFESVTGTTGLWATDVSLRSGATGMTTTPRSGSFYITVVDEVTGMPVAYRIDVNLDGGPADTTLESLAADLTDQVAGVTAALTSDNRLALTADDGLRFVFGFDGQQAREDTSGVLAALGINTFFEGTDARDIVVNDLLVEQPALLAASSTMFVGDGTNAGRIAALDTTAIDTLPGLTIPSSYQSIATRVAVTASAVNETEETASSVLSALRTQKESISGVNLDEEAISLLKYERAYQGAARFISVVDELLNELVLLVR